MQTPMEFIGLSSPQAVILPHTDQAITDQFVDHMIPPTVWDTFKSTANFHSFAEDAVLVQKKRASNIIMQGLQVFWDKARSLQSHGYPLQELKLNIEFKSKVAGLTSNLEISANQMGGSYTQSEILYPAESGIVSTTTTINPECIRDLIDAVHQDQQLSGLSANFIHTIKDFYPKDRNLENVEIVSMSDEKRHLNLFDIAINYSITFFRPQSTLMLTDQTSEMILSSSTNHSTEMSPSNTTDCSLMQVATARHKYSVGLFEYQFSTRERLRPVPSDSESPTTPIL